MKTKSLTRAIIENLLGARFFRVRNNVDESSSITDMDKINASGMYVINNIGGNKIENLPNSATSAYFVLLHFEGVGLTGSPKFQLLYRADTHALHYRNQWLGRTFTIWRTVTTT